MAVSFTGSKGLAGNLPMGGVIQSAVSYSYQAASKVFAARNVYEEVPASLRVELTPTEKDNILIAKAHIAWGGWQRSGSDVALNVRVKYSIDGGQTWNDFGYYAPHSIDLSGVATGCYKHNQGDTNSSFDSDDILISMPAVGTTKHIFAIFWACGYEAGSRTLYWNRSINSGNSYNPTHTCTLQITEIKAK